ncbi:MAG TPA: hypothetical protein VGP15_14685 [Burkholderiales bacterium]|jgi:hypothetical protein|nr:hypothetical protein [Burkholderiales bacterium]
MNNHESRYVARFLAVSRVALGLERRTDTAHAAAPNAADDLRTQPSRRCALAEMRLTEIARLRAGAMRELRAILTPYQRVQLDTRPEQKTS